MTAYEFVIRGELSQRFAYLFDGMSLDSADGRTVVTGEVRDQAHLHALLERIEELNLPLVSVQPVGGMGASR